MKPLYKRLILGFAILIIILIIRFSGVGSYINLEYIRANSLYIQQMIVQNYLFSLFIFLSLYIIFVAASVPVTPALNVAGGFFFGIILGALYSIAGATIGASISFFLFRYLFREFVQRKYGTTLRRFNEEFHQRGISYLLFLQLLPVTPFGLINMLSGVSPISWWRFALATIIGIAPGSFIYAFAGRQLMTIKKASDVFSWPIIIALTLLALFSLLPIIIRKFTKTPLSKVKEE
ncbi:MAG: TVP38/TMEM64 family protein [Candidatus Babeliales bacterium]